MHVPGVLRVQDVDQAGQVCEGEGGVSRATRMWPEVPNDPGGSGRNPVIAPLTGSHGDAAAHVDSLGANGSRPVSPQGARAGLQFATSVSTATFLQETQEMEL